MPFIYPKTTALPIRNIGSHLEFKSTPAPRPNPNISQEDRRLFLKKLSTGRTLGKQLAVQIAKQQQGFKSHQDVVNFYATKFPDGFLPEKWQEQLDWAEEHPHIFEKMRSADVLPLDARFVDPNTFTLVEWIQICFERLSNHYEIRDLEGQEKLSKIYEGVDYEIHYLLNVFNMAKFRSKKDFIERVQSERSEIVIFQRPTGSDSELLDNSGQSKGWRKSFQKRLFVNHDPQRRLRSPGSFIEFQPKTWKTFSGVFWRVSWKKFSTPIDAIDYFLNHGEQSQLTRSNPNKSLLRIARELLRQKGPNVEKLSDGISYSFCPSKCFVSASKGALTYIDDGNPVQCRLLVHTKRAIAVPTSLSNMNEQEVAIPLIINPKEIRRIELNFLSNYKKISIGLDWNEDYTEVVCIIKNPDKKIQTVIGTWNPETRIYDFVEIV